jgi:hypothetical protein
MHCKSITPFLPFNQHTVMPVLWSWSRKESRHFFFKFVAKLDSEPQILPFREPEIEHENYAAFHHLDIKIPHQSHI